MKLPHTHTFLRCEFRPSQQYARMFYIFFWATISNRDRDSSHPLLSSMFFSPLPANLFYYLNNYHKLPTTLPTTSLTPTIYQPLPLLLPLPLPLPPLPCLVSCKYTSTGTVWSGDTKL